MYIECNSCTYGGGGRCTLAGCDRFDEANFNTYRDCLHGPIRIDGDRRPTKTNYCYTKWEPYGGNFIKDEDILI